MEATIINMLKTLLSLSGLLNLLLVFYIFKFNNTKASIKEAPDIFTKQVKELQDFNILNQALKEDVYYVLTVDSSVDENKKELIITNFEKINPQKDLDVKNNLLYIHITNNYLEGAEVKILDQRNREIRFDKWKNQYLFRSQKVGLFINFYQRPTKIYIVYKGIKFIYDIYKSEGAIKVKRLKNGE